MNKPYEIKPLTRDSYVEFYGEPPEYTIKGYAVYYQDQLYCVSGVKRLETTYQWFNDTKDISDVPKMTVWKAAKELYTKIYSMGYPLLYAYANNEIPNSSKFLKKLGFKYIGESEGVDVFLSVNIRDMPNDRCRNSNHSGDGS